MGKVMMDSHCPYTTRMEERHRMAAMAPSPKRMQDIRAAEARVAANGAIGDGRMTRGGRGGSRVRRFGGIVEPQIHERGFISRLESFAKQLRRHILTEAKEEVLSNQAALKKVFLEVKCLGQPRRNILQLGYVSGTAATSESFEKLENGQDLTLKEISPDPRSWRVRVSSVYEDSKCMFVELPEATMREGSKGKLFTLSNQGVADGTNVTAEIQLSSLEMFLSETTCMSPYLRSLLLAEQGDTSVEQMTASRRPQFVDTRVPPDIPRWIAQLGYTLNDSQMRALSSCLSRTLTLVQGPPGTGKSYFAARMIAALVKWNEREHSSACVLVVSESNSAVDNLLQLLENLGLEHMVRVVPSTTERPREGEPQRTISAVAERHSLTRRVQQHMEDHNVSKWDAKRHVLNNARVVLATNTSAAQLAGFKFEFCLMDEGSVTATSSALVPMTLGVMCMVILGDHKQLSPFTNQRNNTVQSFFEWCIEERKVQRCLLDVQYRMHPSISAWPNQMFYDDKVRDDDCVLQGAPPRQFPWQHGSRVLFVNVDRGAETLRHNSWCNEREARVVASIVKRIFRNEGDKFSIGVISYYTQQVKEIRERVNDPRVTVETVDSFQGHERDVILVSTVRTGNRVGFLDNPRRWNVSVTRAKKALIVVGREATLQTDPLIADWLSFLRRRSCIVSEEMLENFVDRAPRESSLAKEAAETSREERRVAPRAVVVVPDDSAEVVVVPQPQLRQPQPQLRQPQPPLPPPRQARTQEEEDHPRKSDKKQKKKEKQEEKEKKDKKDKKSKKAHAKRERPATTTTPTTSVSTSVTSSSNSRCAHCNESYDDADSLYARYCGESCKRAAKRERRNKDKVSGVIVVCQAVWTLTPCAGSSKRPNAASACCTTSLGFAKSPACRMCPA